MSKGTIGGQGGVAESDAVRSSPAVGVSEEGAEVYPGTWCGSSHNL